MPENQEPIENLSIRCPSCRQRFAVGGDLRERMVECGACDHRFRINDDVMLRTKKFYPGERKAVELNRFQRVPLSATMPEGLQTIRYADFDQPEKLEPASPQRIIAGIVGVITMILIALMMIFSSGPGAAFGVMPTQNKLVIAGFVSVLGIALLVYANPKARAKAGFFGLVLAAGLVSLPFFFKGTPIAANTDTITYNDPVEPLFPDEKEKTDPISALRERFTTKPLEAEQTRQDENADGKKAYGIYLTNLLQRNIFTVRDFLIRETQADISSHPYPRDQGHYLMILTGVSMDIATVAEIAGQLGSANEIHPEIGVIVVSVDNDQFADSTADKLNNQDDPAFYKLNLRELGSLDMQRVKRAVGRLAIAEPKIYREDITRGLTELITKPGVSFHDELSRALLVWAEDASTASRAALVVLRREIDAGEPVSENLVALVVKANIPESIPFVQTLWLANPLIWEKYYEEFGTVIEPGILEHLDTNNATLRHSAIRLLERLGTNHSLPALRDLARTGNSEDRVLSERAITKINAR